VEELLRNDARNRNVDFDRAVNDAVRAGPVRNGSGRRFVQKTYSAGSDHLDLSHALAVTDELKDEERIRKMKLAEHHERIREMKLTEKAAERQ
jgi:hypothetical protein